MSEQNYRAFWDEALKQIHDEYKEKGQENEFKIWFKMDYVEDNLSQITVAVPSEFMWSRMVSMGYVEAVQKKIAELSGQNIVITYIESNKPISDGVTTEDELAIDAKKERTTAGFPKTQQSKNSNNNVSQNSDMPAVNPKPARVHPQLDKSYTFETFVPGENSAFAYNASMAIAKNPGKAYNPILIYGGVGLGKTHLMQSIGNYIFAQTEKEDKICYISAENFTNEFTFSIGNKTVDKFKSKYRKLDVLLLDDIHFLIGKPGIQEELFHTFEALHQKRAQMVFTCDRPISELKGIEERLSTRFNSGMTIDLQPPPYEVRHAILQKKLDSQNKTLLPEIVDYIAKNIQSNVRDLASALNKVIGYTELTGQTVTLDKIQNLIRDIASQPSNGTITIELIQKVVANHFTISISDIKSKKRDKKFVIPRQIAIYIARQITEYSFPEIGAEFGGRDHTTAMHSYNKVECQLKTDSSLNSTIQILIREIKDFKK